MKALLACLAALVLTGCASLPKPMTADVATQLKQGKTAVLFYDDIGQINYLEDKYFVLGVAQVASNSAYTGIWNGGPELSQVHAEQFGKLGLQAQSAYNLLPATVIEESTANERSVFTLKPPAKGQKKKTKADWQLSPQLRDALIAQGQDSLVWVSWSGFTLHLQTLGLPTVEKFSTSFWILDLKQNKVVWDGSFMTWENAELGERTGKEFLESDELKGLKRESAEKMRQYYSPTKRSNKDVGTLTGLRGGVSQ